MPPRVSAYMSTPVVTISPSNTLAHARNLMLRYGIGRLVVTDNSKIVGILSMSDFIKVFGHPDLARKALDELVIRDIMSENVHTVRPSDSIVQAARIMSKHRIGSLPVVDDDGSLAGIVTRTDLARAYAENFRGEVKVEDAMNADPPTVSPFHTIHRVIEAMEEKQYFRAVVVDANKPVGIISRRDIIFLSPRKLYSDVKYLKRDKPLPKGRVGAIRTYIIPVAMDIMTPDPATISPDEDLAVAASLMSEKGFSSLPVVDSEGCLLGLVSTYEIVDVISKM